MPNVKFRSRNVQSPLAEDTLFLMNASLFKRSIDFPLNAKLVTLPTSPKSGSVQRSPIQHMFTSHSQLTLTVHIPVRALTDNYL